MIKAVLVAVASACAVHAFGANPSPGQPKETNMVESRSTDCKDEKEPCTLVFVCGTPYPYCDYDTNMCIPWVSPCKSDADCEKIKYEAEGGGGCTSYSCQAGFCKPPDVA